MKDLLLLLFLIFLVPQQTIYGKRIALLIGVGHYPEDSGWHDISSANDIALLSQVLSATGTVSTLTEEAATHSNILRAIQHLTAIATAGDTILLHFSCHGQQMLSHDSNEVDGLDEALIPYDASSLYSDTYHGENHLRDDELSPLLIALRRKIGPSGLLVITLDACYSDSMDRGKGDKKKGHYRGGAAIFGSNTISPDSLTRLTRRRHIADTTTIAKVDEGAEIVMISACTTYEKAKEIVRDSSAYGALSYALYCVLTDETLTSIPSSLDGIIGVMHAIASSQHPQIRTTLPYTTPTLVSPHPLSQSGGGGPSCSHLLLYFLLGGGAAIFIIFILLLLWKVRKRKLSRRQ